MVRDLELILRALGSFWRVMFSDHYSLAEDGQEGGREIREEALRCFRERSKDGAGGAGGGHSGFNGGPPKKHLRPNTCTL